MTSFQYIRWLMVAMMLLALPFPKMLVAGAEDTYSYSDFIPARHIHLKAAVLTAAPPLAVRDDVTREFSGFQIDLLARIQEFARQDGITLTFDLEEGPLYGYTQLLNEMMHDCNSTANPVPYKDCYSYDILIGDFYTSADRSMKVDFTPPWLQTSVSALKKSTTSHDTADLEVSITTMEEADRAKATICALVVHDDGILDAMARIKYPNAKYLECSHMDLCLAELKAGNCSLFINDELKLRHVAVLDPTVVVTKERSNSQFIAWPMRSNLEPIVLRLMRRWVYEAQSSTALDQLFEEYFSVSSCSIGKAGPDCEQPCDPSHGRSDRFGNCVCDSTKWIGDDCSVEVLEDVNALSVPLRGVGYGMVALNTMVVVLCTGWLWVNRSTPQVQVAQPFFLALVLLGCVISTSTILAFGQDSREDGEINSACMSIPWLYSVGFSITFGTLFAKIRSVYIMFQSTVQLKSVSVSVKETLLIISAVLALDVAILTVWTVFDPLEWERRVVTQDKFGEPLSSEGVCVSEHWMAFAGTIGCLHFCLLGFASYYCYRARHIPTRFSEGRYVTLAIVSNLQIFVVAVPVLVVLGSEPQANFFVRSIIVWMNDLVVVTLIFGNLMWSVRKDYKNDISGAESIRLSMAKFTQQQLRSSAKNSNGSECVGSIRTRQRLVSHFSSQLEDVAESNLGEEQATEGEISGQENGNGTEYTPGTKEKINAGAKHDETLATNHLDAVNLERSLHEKRSSSEKSRLSSRNLSAPSSPKHPDDATGSTGKLSFTSMLGMMSSVTLSEIDEEMPFDSASRYSEHSKGMSDKPPLFPQRTPSTDSFSLSDGSQDSHSDTEDTEVDENQSQDQTRDPLPQPSSAFVDKHKDTEKALCSNYHHSNSPASTDRTVASSCNDTLPSLPKRRNSQLENSFKVPTL